MAACVHGVSPLGVCGVCSPPTSSSDRWRWLASTVDLQRDAFGDNEQPKTGEALANSVMMNAVALGSELHEALNEVGWKPWATPRGWLNRDAYLRELVDVGHFLANLLVAVGCTDEEWEERYRAKQLLNLKRQRDGYDGRNKCPHCGRALDEVGVTVDVMSVAMCLACRGTWSSNQQPNPS